MPTLIINKQSIEHNVQSLVKYSKARNIELIGVIKCFEKLQFMIDLFYQHGINFLGIGDLYSAKKLKRKVDTKLMLLSIPVPNQANEVVKRCHISLNSELETIKQLAVAAKKANTIHEIILMIDIGDLREGVMPDDAMTIVRCILQSNFSHLNLKGIGANLACCSGTLPSLNNLFILHDTAQQIENRFNYPLKTISIGGSVMLDWIENNPLPNKINQLRIGEAFFLGTIPGLNKPHHCLKQDAFTFIGEVLELKYKPSIPTGKLGKDALRTKPSFIQKGIRKRVVMNFGAVHTNPAHLVPILEQMQLISVNSNYSVYDVTDCIPDIKSGDTIQFQVTYASLIQCLLSPYVKHIIKKRKP